MRVHVVRQRGKDHVRRAHHTPGDDDDVGVVGVAEVDDRGTPGAQIAVEQSARRRFMSGLDEISEADRAARGTFAECRCGQSGIRCDITLQRPGAGHGLGAAEFPQLQIGPSRSTVMCPPRIPAWS